MTLHDRKVKREELQAELHVWYAMIGILDQSRGNCWMGLCIAIDQLRTVFDYWDTNQRQPFGDEDLATGLPARAAAHRPVGAFVWWWPRGEMAPRIAFCRKMIRLVTRELEQL